MKKKKLWLSVAAVAVILAVVGVWALWLDGEDDRYWVHEFHDAQKIYVDDTAVRGDGTLSDAQKKVETFILEKDMERVYEVHQGFDAFPEGMSSTQVGLSEEMDARLSVLYSKNKGHMPGNWKFYAIFEDIDVREDAAKVVVRYRIEDADRDGEVVEEEAEVLFLTPGMKDWTYVNLISTEGGTDPAFFEKACASDDPTAWLTTYSYNECKRRDYAGGIDYVDYMNGAEGIDPSFAGQVAAASGKTEAEPDYDLREIGNTIRDRRQEDGSCVLFGTDYSHARFTPEAFDDVVKLSGDAEKAAIANKNSNIGQIEGLVATLNSTYLSSRYSGIYRLCPRECFASDAVYKEVNARTLVDMFANPNLGVNVYDGSANVWVEALRIDGDWAKVVVQRSLNIGYSVMIKPIYDETVKEGYLLKKVDGRWVIENVLFASEGIDQTFQDFMVPAGKAKDWEKHYRFDVCRRADTQNQPNYSDFVKGNIEAPVMILQ